MTTKSRESIYGGSIRASAERAQEARKGADRLACIAWNQRMLGYHGPAQPSPALGALQDPRVAEHEEQVVLNLGNMHALGFSLSGTHVHALFEHHTELLDTARIEAMTEQLVEGTLTHEEVFAGAAVGCEQAVSRALLLLLHDPMSRLGWGCGVNLVRPDLVVRETPLKEPIRGQPRQHPVGRVERQ